MKLRDYQIDISNKTCELVKQNGLAYIVAEVRTGKTLMALEACKLLHAKNVLFLTKKKAIQSILNDYNQFQYSESFELTVINDESMHTIQRNDFDIVIHDEHHRHGAFPKPGKYTKMFRDKFGDLPMIFLSGTPVPESPMQWFHQFWVSKRYSPFKEQSFYKWFDACGFVKKQFDLGYGIVANYANNEDVIHKYYSIKTRSLSKNDNEYQDKLSKLLKNKSNDIQRVAESNKRLLDYVSNYIITFTQKEAGFETKVSENVLSVKMNDTTYKLCNKLKQHNIARGEQEVILADTAVKLMGKLLQLSSGTVLFESGNSMVIDTSKVDFIANHFKGKRMGIFYKFKAELDMIKNKFGEDVTASIDEFNEGTQHIALQYLSGREGISLKNADVLIFLTPDFSATTYLQARDRLTTMDRKENDMYWILSDKGIDNNVYRSVVKKETYTTKVFTKDIKSKTF